MDVQKTKRKSDEPQPGASEISKKPKTDEKPLTLPLTSPNDAKADNKTKKAQSVQDDTQGVNIRDAMNSFVEHLDMLRVPGTPLYTKTHPTTGERILFMEAGFLTIITSKGNRRRRIDFKQIDMEAFNRTLNEATVVMIPVMFLYKHYITNQPSQLRYHQDHCGMIIYWKDTKRFIYVDARLHSEVPSVTKDVRVKKVRNIAMRFLRLKLKLEGTYKSQKLSEPNPNPNEPHVPLLWIVEYIVNNPNGPFRDPYQSADMGEHKKRLMQVLKLETDANSSQVDDNNDGNENESNDLNLIEENDENEDEDLNPIKENVQNENKENAQNVPDYQMDIEWE